MSLKSLLERIGIHIHTWVYYSSGRDYHRKCACGRHQIHLFVPAAPGAFEDWIDDEFV